MTTDVAIVTGESRGIGRAIAIELASQGIAVAVNYAASADKAEDVVAVIEASGGTARAVRADVSDAASVEEMFREVSESLGPVTVLVNNAGITDDGLILRMDEDQWDRVITTNLTSVYLCTKQALRSMIRNN